MFINDDNNRDNYNYPIGERDYLSECETPNIRKYYKLLVHTVKLGHIRTKCITWWLNNWISIIFNISEKTFRGFLLFPKETSNGEICLLLYIEKTGSLCEPVCFPGQFVKTKFHSYYKLLAHNSHSTTLRNTPRNRNRVLRLLKFRDYKRSDRFHPITQLHDGRSTNPIKQKSIEIYACGWFVLGTGASAFRKRLRLSNRSCPPCENHFPITTKKHSIGSSSTCIS